MGAEFLNSINQSGSLRPLALRDVGDQCLLYSGLFPGRAIRRRVRVSYYVNIGKSAYSSLATSGNYSDSSLFATLSNKFVCLMDILQSMRGINEIDPMTAAEIWHDTGSNHALKTLQTLTNNHISPLICDIQLSNSKH